MVLKKQIVRTLIEEIVVDVEKPQNDIVLVIHWAGGHHTELREPTHWRKRRGKSVDLKKIIATLRKLLTDEAIASVLNREKLTTCDGATWTKQGVEAFRTENRIAIYSGDTKEGHGWMTQAEAATYLQISPMSMTRFVQMGIIPAEQPCPGFPTVIKKEDLEIPRIKEAVSQLKTSNKRPLSHHPDQRNLFDVKDF